MIRLRNAPQRFAFALTPASLLIILCMSLAAYGCKHRISHTSDPQLQKIDEILSTHCPPGTPRGLVQNFLKSRGYELEIPPNKESLRALIRHVDTETLQPSAAHATFYFDSNGNLTSFDLQPMASAPLRP
jgi:hypothetical protein